MHPFTADEIFLVSEQSFARHVKKRKKERKKDDNEMTSSFYATSFYYIICPDKILKISWFKVIMTK